MWGKALRVKGGPIDERNEIDFARDGRRARAADCLTAGAPENGGPQIIWSRLTKEVFTSCDINIF